MSDVALRFGAKDDGLSAQFAKTAKQLKDFEEGSNKVSASISASFTTLAKVVGSVSLVKLASEAIEFADQLAKASVQTGISVEALQNLQFISSQTSVSFDSITRAVNMFQRQLVEGGKAATEALGQLGISIAEIDRMSPDQQFARIAQGISEVEDPAQRTALAMQIFGKSGADLLPILTQTGEQMSELGARFEELGGPVSAEAIQKLDDLGDSFDALKGSAINLGVELVGLVAGPLKLLTDGLGSAVGAARNLGKDIKFISSGGTLGEELAFLERQIAALENAAPDTSRLFRGPMDELTSSGYDERSHDRLLARLRAQANIVREMIEMSRGVELQEFSALLAPEQPIHFRPRVPTQQDLRLQYQASGDAPLQDMGLELVELNQSALDEMIRQDTEAMAQRIQIASDGARLMAEIRETFGLQEVSFERAKTASIVDIAGGLFGALARENSKVAKVQQALAIAQTLWHTSTGVMHAMAQLPWPANIAAAAKVAAMGAINVAKIKAANYNGGGSVSGVGGSSIGGSVASSSGATNLEQDGGIQSQGVVQIILSGDMYGFDDFEEKVVRAVRESVNDRDVVIINPASRQALELVPTPA